MEYFVLVHKRHARRNYLAGVVADYSGIAAARQLGLTPPVRFRDYFQIRSHPTQLNYGAQDSNGVHHFFGEVKRLKGKSRNQLEDGRYYWVEERSHDERYLMRGRFRGIVVAANLKNAIRKLGLKRAPDTLHFQLSWGLGHALDKEEKNHYSFYSIPKRDHTFDIEKWVVDGMPPDGDLTLVL